MADDKYIVFKRDEFLDAMGIDKPAWSSFEIDDAIVIRRQDYFASPALAGYAASIAIALHLVEDPKLRRQLQDVADYFQRQSELAAEEGWKLPDL